MRCIRIQVLSRSFIPKNAIAHEMKFFAFQAKGLRAQGPPTPPPEKWECGHVTTRQDYLYGTVRTAAFSEQKKAAMYEK